MTRPHLIDRSHRYEGPLPDPRDKPQPEHWFKPSFITAALAGVAVATMMISYLVGLVL